MSRPWVGSFDWAPDAFPWQPRTWWCPSSGRCRWVCRDPFWPECNWARPECRTCPSRPTCIRIETQLVPWKLIELNDKKKKMSCQQRAERKWVALREFPEGLVRLAEVLVLPGISVATSIAHPHVVASIGQQVSCKNKLASTTLLSAEK